MHLWLILPCLLPPLHLSSSPEAADSCSFDVQLGDIILTASDGLFDNMPDYMILQELKKLKVPLQECKYFHTVSTGGRVILLVCAHFRLPAMTVSCRLHRALHSKLMTWPTTPTICPHLHSLPVIMAWMLEVRMLTHYLMLYLSIQVFMSSVSGVWSGFIHTFLLVLPDLHILSWSSWLAGGKPDDITVLLSIVAEYTDWTCVSVLFECVYMCLRLVLLSPLPESSTCSPPDSLWEAAVKTHSLPPWSWRPTVSFVLFLELQQEQAARIFFFFMMTVMQKGTVTHMSFWGIGALMWCNETMA